MTNGEFTLLTGLHWPPAEKRQRAVNMCMCDEQKVFWPSKYELPQWLGGTTLSQCIRCTVLPMFQGKLAAGKPRKGAKHR